MTSVAIVFGACFAACVLVDVLGNAPRYVRAAVAALDQLGARLFMGDEQ